LFCLPYAGGSAAIYREWDALLSPYIELIAIELPGHGTRRDEALFNTSGPLLDALAPVVAADLDKPFALFGHSMGALIAYELARRLLILCNKQPVRLFASGRRAPDFPDTRKPAHNLPDEEFIAELRRLNGTPAEVLADPELLGIMLPMLRADFELTETFTHEPGPTLTCPVSAYGGLSDFDVGQKAIEAWRGVSSGPFTLRMFQGGHFFIHSVAPLLTRLIELDLHAR
jgi:medium-chain acyl-[acyl-carrier-protein] hydrolase